MKPGRFFLLALCICSFSAFAQPPQHTRLLFEDSLRSAGPKAIGEIVNSGGMFIPGQGWQSTGRFSQLRVQMAEYLPFEGTLEVRVKNFYPPGQLLENSVSPLSLWSRPSCSLGPLDTTMASFIYIKCEKKFNTENTAKLLFRVHPNYHSDALGQPRQSKETEYLAWDTETEYSIKVVWNPREAWLLIDNREVAYRNLMNTDFWKENFAYLCLGNSTWDGMVGPIYTQLRLLVPQTSLPFRDRSKSARLEIDRMLGAQGVAAVDINQDDREDLYLNYSAGSNASRVNKLFVQQPDSTFIDEATLRGLDQSGDWGAALFFDADLDGDMDLFQTDHLASPRFYVNNDGRFSDQSAAWGVAGSGRNSQAVLSMDVERDGDLDVLVIDASLQHEKYVNNGRAGFIRSPFGETTEIDFVQGAVAGDFTGDDLFDIFITRENAACVFYVNQGNGDFKDEAAARGLAKISRAAAPSCIDLDNDGDLDLVWPVRGESTDRSPLANVFINDGTGHFIDQSAPADIHMDAYALYPGDVDNDGRIDLYGMRYDRALEEGPTSAIFLNQGDGAFAPVLRNGADHIFIDGRAAAVADFNRDGRLDIFGSAKGRTEPYQGQPYGRSALLINQSISQNHFLAVKGLAPADPRTGPVAKIHLYQTGHLDDPAYLLGFREMIGNQGYASQTSLIQHFGLGQHSSVDLRATSTTGQTAVWREVAVDQLVSVQIKDLSAYSMALVGSPTKTGQVRTRLSDSISVQVVDRQGNGVAGHKVSFEIKIGGGTLNSGSTAVERLTNSLGFAAVDWILGSQAGLSNNVLSIAAVTKEGTLLQNAPIAVTASAQPGPPRKTVLLGDGQSAVRAQSLPEPIGLFLYDDYDNPLSAVPITFTVLTGMGKLTPQPVVVTDHAGKAMVNWQLGPAAGKQQVQAVIPDYPGSPLLFSATSLLPQPHRILALAGDQQIGVIHSPLPDSFKVLLIDHQGQGIYDFPVYFHIVQAETGQRVYADSVLTDQRGLARLSYHVGTLTGAFRAMATAPGLGDSVVFHFIVQQEPCLFLSANAIQPQYRPFQEVSILVHAQDALGRPASGQSLQFEILVGDGALTQPNPIKTDEKGDAVQGWQLGVQAEQRLFVKTVGIKSLSADGLQEGFTFSTHVLNHRPVLAALESKEVTVGEQVTAVISATDADGDSLQFFVRGLPAGATFDSTITRQFSWSVDSSYAGKSCEIRFIARDLFQAADTAKWLIQVKPLNRSPILLRQSPADTLLALNYNVSYVFSVQAFDPDRDSLSFKWLVNDAFAGDDSTLLVQFTQALFPQQVQVSVLVSDAAHTVTQRWRIHLDPVHVLISQFSAGLRSGLVELSWRTAEASDLVGFTLLRGEQAEGPFQSLCEQLIPVRQDGSYTFKDHSGSYGKRYYLLQYLHQDGTLGKMGPIEIDSLLPDHPILAQNYPNPFNPTTTITFTLPKAQSAELRIYNLSGQWVRTLTAGVQSAGVHQAVWDGRDDQGRPVTSGLYYVVLQAADKVITRKLLFAK